VVNHLSSYAIAHSPSYVDRTKREDVGGCQGIRVEGTKGRADSRRHRRPECLSIRWAPVPEVVRTSYLTSRQLPPSTAFAECETRTSGNSWTVSTSPRKVPSLRSRLVRRCAIYHSFSTIHRSMTLCIRGSMIKQN